MDGWINKEGHNWQCKMLIHLGILAGDGGELVKIQEMGQDGN